MNPRESIANLQKDPNPLLSPSQCQRYPKLVMSDWLAESASSYGWDPRTWPVKSHQTVGSSRFPTQQEAVQAGCWPPFVGNGGLGKSIVEMKIAAQSDVWWGKTFWSNWEGFVDCGD